MASAEIALLCGLKVRVRVQNMLWANSDADETLAWCGRYVSEVLHHSYRKFMLKSAV